MLKRVHLSAWAVLFMVAAMFGITHRAQAQPNNSCCTFTVVASAILPPGCFPITVTTNWGAGAGVTQNDALPGPGVPTVFTVPGCPPFQNFNWVSLDGGVTRVPLGGGAFFTLPCGRVVCLFPVIDANGCVFIRISLSATCPP